MFGEFIRRVRTSRGWSQQDLASLIGTSQPTLSAYEHDRKLPSAETLNRIIVACGYLLCASDGHRRITCALPRIGWFPDDDLPEDDELSRQIAGQSRRESAMAGSRHVRLPLEERARVNAELLSAGERAIGAGRAR